MKICFLIILQFLFFNLLGQSQLSKTEFTKISVNDGLSQNIVEAIHQDAQGFLWFGTQDGLDRFDGQNFKTFNFQINDSNSLSNNYIKFIHEDSNEDLWIGTYGGGLNRFDKKSKFDRYLHDITDKNSISDNVVYTYFRANDSIMWLGTKNGLNKFNVSTGNFTNVRTNPEIYGQLSNEVVYCIAPSDNPDEIWVGTRNGLNLFNTSNQEAQSFYEGKNGLTDDDIRDLYLDKNGILWVATKMGGLFYKDKNSNFFHKVKILEEGTEYARKIYPAENGAIWLGTFGQGLFYINSNKKIQHNFSTDIQHGSGLTSKNIVSLFQDESGQYWVGTHGAGVLSFNLSKRKFQHYQYDKNDPSSLSHNATNYIFEDSRGSIYIANDAGIDLMKEENNQITFNQVISSYSDQYDNRGWLLYEDSDQTLWIGMWNFGLSQYNRESGELRSFKNIPNDSTSITTNFIESIVEANDGKLWIGLLGDGGLVVFDKKLEQFKRYLNDPKDANSLSNNRVNTVFIDSRDRIWLGTDFGLNLYIPQYDNFRHFRYDPLDSLSLNYNVVSSIFEDSQSNIWIGTKGGGFSQLIESDQDNFHFKSFTSENGLANNNIAGIVEDAAGFLWISTSSGLSRFNKNDNAFKNYGLSDGLQGKEFITNSIQKVSDGRIFIGGYNGLNIFNPLEIADSHYQPSVNLVALDIVSKSGQQFIDDYTIDSLILNHTDYLLSFEVAATDYTALNESKYAYQLEGFDNDWVDNKSRRHFTFTNLPAGEYNLKVKATNSDGVWSDNILSIYVKVNPPFWATLWFKILLAVFILTAILIYIRLRLNSLRKAKNLLQLKVEERTKELQVANQTLLKNQKLVNEQKDQILYQHHEITEKNKIIQRHNDDLKLTNLQLEEMVEERTKKLQETNNDLQIAKHEFDTFFYRASHDLKGPVATIIGLCYLALKELKDVPGRFYITKMQETAERMNSILFNLQKINKLKQRDLIIEPINMLDVITMAIEEIIPDNENRGQFIDFDFEGITNQTQLFGDVIHLKIIFSNLIDNALKFAKNLEKPKVNISFKEDLKSNQYTITFEDFGVGINDEVKDKVFNMFFVATNQNRGYGLGLYSVRMAVRKLGGNIHLDNTDNNRSKFIISLPIPEYQKILV